jgi:hypothetical protein
MDDSLIARMLLEDVSKEKGAWEKLEVDGRVPFGGIFVYLLPIQD